MQNIAGNCQQTLCFQMFVGNTQQCFALLPYAQFFKNDEAEESEVNSFLF